MRNSLIQTGVVNMSMDEAAASQILDVKEYDG